jgi:hypothetical protein
MLMDEFEVTTPESQTVVPELVATIMLYEAIAALRSPYTGAHDMRGIGSSSPSGESRYSTRIRVVV